MTCKGILKPIISQDANIAKYLRLVDLRRSKNYKFQMEVNMFEISDKIQIAKDTFSVWLRHLRL